MRLQELVLIIFSFQLLTFPLSCDEITVVQKNWFCGPGRLVDYYEWDCKYFRDDSLITSNRNITFKSSGFDPSDCDTMILLSGAAKGYICYDYADFDNDGDKDFAIGNGQFLHVIENFGDTLFSDKPLLELSNPANYIKTTNCGDFNNDGYQDIFYATRFYYGICWGAGSILYGWDCDSLLENITTYYDGEVVDIDEDDTMDIVGIIISDSTDDYIGILLGPDLDSVIYLTKYDLGTAVISRTRVLDFDKDNDYDIVIAYHYPGSVIVLRNDGTSFSSFYRLGFPSVDGIGIGDFNRDGFDDIVLGSHSGKFYLMRNDAGSGFDSLSLIHSVNDYVDGADVVDFDLNGTLDIIGGWHDVGFVSQTSTGSFTDIELVDEPAANRIHFGRVLDLKSECGYPAKDFFYTVGGFYFTLLKNSIAKFPSFGFLESSVLAFRTAKNLLSFGWSDCIPDGFDIRYYVRTAKTVEKCQRTPWIEVPSSGADLSEPIDTVCELCFQYRIEFERTTGSEKLSPDVDSVYMILEDDTLDYTVILTPWFYEETFCDSINTVIICYDLDACDDTFHTLYAYASRFPGDTFIALSTLSYTTNSYGDATTVGEHCFDWSLSSDMPGEEGSNWILKFVVDSAYDAIVEGPLDSKPPEIIYDTPFDIVAGDTALFSFSIEDSFYSGDSSMVYIEYCSIMDSFKIAGTTFKWFLQPDTCDSIRMTVVTRDSFCNIGSDTNYFSVTPCIPETAWVVCAPCDDYSACDSQVVEIIIYDYQGYSIDTLNTFFTLLNTLLDPSIQFI